jgi:tight adherence protein C
MTQQTLLLTLGCIGMALLAAGMALDSMIARKRRAEIRFDRYCLRLETTRRAETIRELLSRNLGALIGPSLSAFSRAFFAREKDRSEMRKLLWAAGYRSEHALTALAAAKLGGAALGAVAGAAFALRDGGAIDMFGAAMMAGGGVMGAIAPERALASRRDARRGRIRNALPDAIDLMVIAAYAGQSLDMALDRISREMRAFAPDIAEELAIVTAELQALPDRTEALRNFGERVDLREARAFALTLIQTIRYGSPFTESLKALGGDLRQAKMIAAEERGAKLPALLTLPLIVFIMPAVFVVVVGPAAISMGDLFGGKP